mmetsp:Transcript_3521/g.6634  ORF Transcript_3521/g.6634 Transcript_3521/m.6634 type:complete len:91 (+) Transcript_3521:1207-1479(+)
MLLVSMLEEGGAKALTAANCQLHSDMKTPMRARTMLPRDAILSICEVLLRHEIEPSLQKSGVTASGNKWMRKMTSGWELVQIPSAERGVG